MALLKLSLVLLYVSSELYKQRSQKKSSIEMWCCLAGWDRGLGLMMNVVGFKHKHGTASNLEQPGCTKYVG